MPGSTVLGREGVAWVTARDQDRESRDSSAQTNSLYLSPPIWQSGVPNFSLRERVNPEKGQNCRDLFHATNSFCLVIIRLKPLYGHGLWKYYSDFQHFRVAIWKSISRNV